MNKQESFLFLAMIQASYPNYHAKSDKHIQIAAATIFQQILNDIDYELAQISLLSYVGKGKEFPPNAGQIREIANTIIADCESKMPYLHDELPVIEQYKKTRYNKNIANGKIIRLKVPVYNLRRIEAFNENSDK